VFRYLSQFRFRSHCRHDNLPNPLSVSAYIIIYKLMALAWATPAMLSARASDRNLNYF